MTTTRKERTEEENSDSKGKASGTEINKTEHSYFF